jgi:predicted NAD/FAD-binding protein
MECVIEENILKSKRISFHQNRLVSFGRPSSWTKHNESAEFTAASLLGTITKSGTLKIEHKPFWAVIFEPIGLVPYMKLMCKQIRK